MNFLRLKNLAIAISGCAILFGCTQEEILSPDPTPESIAIKLKNSDRLYVTEYVVHKIVTANDVKHLKGTLMNHKFALRWTIGDRKVAIPMDAVLKAFIDFENLQPEDISIGENKTLKITLPEPQVEMTSSKIDHASIREYTGILRSSFKESELSEFEKQGREVILASVPNIGIMKTAKQNAREVLVPILMQAGFEPEQIAIYFKTTNN